MESISSWKFWFKLSSNCSKGIFTAPPERSSNCRSTPFPLLTFISLWTISPTSWLLVRFSGKTLISGGAKASVVNIAVSLWIVGLVTEVAVTTAVSVIYQSALIATDTVTLMFSEAPCSSGPIILVDKAEAHALLFRESSYVSVIPL